MQRNATLDGLRLILAVMVVLIHTPPLTGKMPALSHVLANGICRLAVPAFFVINGFYLYSAVRAGKTRAWFKRGIVLYAIWMAFYANQWLKWTYISLDEGATIFTHAVTGFFHLWYLAAMIWAGALLVLVRKLPTPVISAGALLLFAAGVAIQYTRRYHVLDGNLLYESSEAIHLHRNYAMIAFPFLWIGYAIHGHRLHRKVSRPAVVILSLLGLALITAEGTLNATYGLAGENFDNLASLILVAPALVLLAMRFPIDANTRYLAQFATALYLVHPFFAMTVRGIKNIQGTGDTIYVLVVGSLAAIALTLVHRRAGWPL